MAETTQIPDLNVSNEGKQKIKHMIHCADYRRQREMDLQHAIAAHKTAMDDVGAWLCPHDAKDGETFSIWVVDALLSVTFQPNSETGSAYLVFWRNGKTPKEKL